ncbi:MAG: hypothetical protein GF331_27040, partial [Chitinivibrionales bacterium]|nr:hypothetical protein [Chitinivibrionales bacterium]
MRLIICAALCTLATCPAAFALSLGIVTYGPQDSCSFAWSLAVAGDVNGDGYSDFLVGAPHYTNPDSSAGMVFLYGGETTPNLSAPLWSYASPEEGAEVGWEQSSAGDFNGDGYSDIAIGASGMYDDTGAVLIFLGRRGQAPASTPSLIIKGEQPGADFGATLACAGDVNGDGFSDLLVGAACFDQIAENIGKVYLYHGRGDLQNLDAPDWTTQGNVESGFYGMD